MFGLGLDHVRRRGKNDDRENIIDVRDHVRILDRKKKANENVVRHQVDRRLLKKSKK